MLLLKVEYAPIEHLDEKDMVRVRTLDTRCVIYASKKELVVTDLDDAEHEQDKVFADRTGWSVGHPIYDEVLDDEERRKKDAESDHKND